MSMTRLNVIVILVVLGLTGGFVIGLLAPGLQELEACQDRVTREAEQVKQDQEELGNFGDLFASIERLDEQMRDFRTRLPADRQFGEFLSALSDILKDCEIDNYVVQPRSPRPVDDAKLPEAFAVARGTTVLPVSISFQADFTQLFEFLNRLEVLPRLSHVETMTLLNEERQPGNISVEMMLHTYHRPE